MMKASYRFLQGPPVRREVYEIVKARPGITTKEICELLPERSEYDVHCTVARMNGRLIHPVGRGSKNSRKWEVI